MKTILTFIILFAISTSSYAEVGVKAGMNFSKFSDDFLQNPEFRIGYIVGIFKEFQLSEDYFIEPQILFLQRGTEYNSTVYPPENLPPNFSTDTVNVELRYELKYFKLPILFGYKITNKFKVKLGPSLEYLLSGKAESEVTNYPKEKHTLKHMSDFTYGVNLGFSWNISKRFSLEGIYYYGFKNVFDSKDTKAKSRDLQFALNYSF